MKNKSSNIIARNKRANFNYEISKTFEVGIVLTGCEIKSIRNNNVNLNDSYINFKNNELFIHNMYIAPYENGSFSNSDPYRAKKLLLHKSELLKLRIDQKTNKFSIVPIHIYFSGKLVKVLVGIGKPKKLYDKRQAIAKRDSNLQINKALKQKNQ